MGFRHEWKIEITRFDHLALRSRLQAVAQPDPHAVNGRYGIRSLYFDDFADTALREKTDGISRREKFRIRYYNQDTSTLHLEKKCKLGGLCSKQSATLRPDQAQAVIDGDLLWMAQAPAPLLQEFYRTMRFRLLRPKVIVDYVREPFVYEPGNVRVTFDFDLRTSRCCAEFLRPDCITIPAGNAPILMEVKWDAFLPDIIRDAIQLPGRRAAAFSKYAQCRIYG